MKAIGHIHRYKKVNLARGYKDKEKKPYYVYKCVKPICSHYVPIELAEGKLCECNRCGESMLISKKVLTGSSGRPMAKPHCTDCIERKNKKEIAALAKFLEGDKTSL